MVTQIQLPHPTSVDSNINHSHGHENLTQIDISMVILQTLPMDTINYS